MRTGKREHRGQVAGRNSDPRNTPRASADSRVLETCPWATVGLAENGSVVEWSPRAAELLGRERETVVGQQFAKLFLPPPHRKRFTEELRRHNAPGHAEQTSLRALVLGCGGATIPTEVWLTTLSSADAMRHVVYLRDLSEERMRESRLGRQAMEARLLQQAMVFSASAATFEDSLRWCLEVMCEITGWSVGHVWLLGGPRGELRSSGIWHSRSAEDVSLLAEESKELTLQSGEELPGRVLESGEAAWVTDVHAEQAFRRDSARTLPIKGWFGFPILSHDGIAAVLEFFSPSEITPDAHLLLLVANVSNQLGRVIDRRRWEEGQVRLASIVKSSSDAILSVDLDGHITSWNAGAESTYGYSASEALGQPVDLILPETGRTRQRDEILTVQASQPQQQRDAQRRCKDGRPLQASSTISVIRDATGRTTGISLIERDVTLLKRREQALEEAKEAAEAASRAKSEFLANISHELRTPMNAIMGMVDLSLGESELKGTVVEYLQTARESSRMLLSLLDDLLDLSRMEAHGLELDVRPFQIRSLITETVRMLGLRAQERGLELACFIDSAVPDRLIGDPVRLRQILINLVANAIKFTNVGEVTVQVECDRVPNQEKQIELRLIVEDTGIGISESDQRRIFEPFTQADGSLTRRHMGAGLGLAICRTLAEQMSGSISVTSVPQQGTKFCCRLRLGFVESAHPPVTKFHAHQKFLVVDRHRGSQKLLSRALRSYALIVSACSTIDEALHELQNLSGSTTAVLFNTNSGSPEQFETLCRAALLLPNPPQLILLGWPGECRVYCSAADPRLHCRILHKPLSQPELERALKANSSEPAMIEHEKATGSGRRLSILVAEDTPANQKVIRALLRRRGHAVDVVSNGREAIDRLPRRRYDVVLMDVQMPYMDGLQATSFIRGLDSELSHIPIVAMTAHTMHGHRDRCLAAGMDGYLTKPLDALELVETVEQVTHAAPKSEGPAAVESPATPNPQPVPGRRDRTPAAMDLNAALRRLGGDRQLLRDLAGFFLEDSATLVNDLRNAADRGDMENACIASHSLKGLGANFDAHRLVQQTQAAEDAARAGDRNGVRERLEPVEAETARLRDALSGFLAEDQS